MSDNTTTKHENDIFHNVDSRTSFLQINQNVNALGEGVNVVDHPSITRRRALVSNHPCLQTSACLTRASAFPIIDGCPHHKECTLAKKFILIDA
jgi:hypothetical protein